jgi:DhnA family fructose-bisphosphate aldolase class Ia
VSDTALSPAEVSVPETLGAPPVCTSYAEVTELRSRDPQAIRRALAARSRRPAFLPEDGRLMLVAADHPARGALSAQGRPAAMNSRTDMLDRLRAALARPGVDGLLATADIAEDLLLLGALEDKVVVASMNRGGLAGASFELDDRMTGYDVAGVVEARFDAAKMLNRIDLDDPGTVRMLETTGRTISALARAGIAMMLEPFLSRRVDGRVVNDLTPDGVIKSVHVAQGLGATSAYTWLKLPVTEDADDMAAVLETSTLPVVLLGGEAGPDQDGLYERWRKALRLPTVQGLVAGRTLLYPATGSVEEAVDTAVGLL